MHGHRYYNCKVSLTLLVTWCNYLHYVVQVYSRGAHGYMESLFFFLSFCAYYYIYSTEFNVLFRIRIIRRSSEDASHAGFVRLWNKTPQPLTPCLLLITLLKLKVQKLQLPNLAKIVFTTIQYKTTSKLIAAVVQY